MRRISLTPIIILAYLTVLALLVALCIVRSAGDRHALIPVASTWGLAGLAAIGGYQKNAKKGRSDRRNAYRHFLELSDQLVEARKRCDNAQTALEAAAQTLAEAEEAYQYNAPENGDGLPAAMANDAAAHTERTAAKAAFQNLEGQLAEAQQRVRRLARRRVRPAFESLLAYPPEDTEQRRVARACFYAKALADLRLGRSDHL